MKNNKGKSTFNPYYIPSKEVTEDKLDKYIHDLFKDCNKRINMSIIVGMIIGGGVVYVLSGILGR